VRDIAWGWLIPMAIALSLGAALAEGLFRSRWHRHKKHHYNKALKIIYARISLMRGIIASIQDFRQANLELILSMIDQIDKEKTMATVDPLQGIKDALVRGETSTANLLSSLSDQAEAIQNELNQVATGGAGIDPADITAIADRVGAMADTLDTGAAQVKASTEALRGDDPIPGGGDGGPTEPPPTARARK
jgi:hypothetical protein